MQFWLGSYRCERELSCMSDGDVGAEESKSCPPCIPHPFLPPFYL